MISIVFDTSILIDSLRKKEEAKNLLSKVENKEIMGYISSVVEAELFSGRECLIESKRRAVIDLIKLFEKTLVTNDVAQKAGEFRRKYNLNLLDCIIAATAFIKKAKVWTRNVEHFKKIREIKVEEPY